MLDLDRMPAAELIRFAENVIDSYAMKIEKITKGRNIRSQKWNPYIPEAWRVPERKPSHSSYGPSIPIQCMGLTSANPPTYTRPSPDPDVNAARSSDVVENYLHAIFEEENKNGIAGNVSWIWINDQMNNYGGCCIGTILAPHAWADAPAMSDRENKIRQEFWRNKRGNIPDDGEPFDDVASAKAFLKAVEEHRRRAEGPVIRRYVPFDQAYPVVVGRTMMAMVIRRQASALEMTSLDFIMNDGSPVTVDKTEELTEIWTPRKARYFIDGGELKHEIYGDTGIVHNYGFIPYVYKVGIPDDDCAGEFGVWGSPVLSIVADQIINIDTIQTVQMNAAYQAGYPTPVAEDVAQPDAVSMAAGDGKMQHLEIKSGVVNYFPGKRLSYLLNNGTGIDFDKELSAAKEELRRLLPDALLGQAASSGYNTAQAIQQGMGFLGAVIEGTQALMATQGSQELHLINDFVPGPIFFNYAYRDNNFGSGPLHMRNLRITSDDINNYFPVNVEISRVVDQITLSAHMAQLQAQGLASVREVMESRGVTDTEALNAEILVDAFRKQAEPRLMQDAVDEAGMGPLQKEMAAEQQLTTLPDGSQGVAMPGGGVAAPGLPGQTIPGNAKVSFTSAPSPAQLAAGPAGALLGGFNLNSPGPNPASTANPTQLLPTPAQPNRFRRKGGALPGATQKQGWSKTTQGKLG